MTGAVDYSREAHAYLSRLLTHLHPQCEPLPDLMGLCTQIDNAMTEIKTLRAALDAVEREKDEARARLTNEGLLKSMASLEAFGYARGVRDAAEVCRHQADTECSAPKDLRSGYECERRILALLPKETRDDR